MQPPAQRHPHFFTGNFAPLTEEFELSRIPTEGIWPQALSGTLFRVGPNPQFAPRDDQYHWFSGDGMVHAFHIDQGQVRYRNRWARTPKWQLEHAAGRSLFGTFGNPMTSDPSAHGRNGGTANTSMLWHAGRLFALEESHLPFELDPFTLGPLGHQDFGEPRLSRVTAHPKVDPVTGELLFFAYAADGPDSTTMLYGSLDARCRLTRLESFTAPHAAMAHDFMITRQHVLFPVTPLTLSTARARRGMPMIAWEQGRRTQVGVMRRNASPDTLRWFQTDGCHVFHTMNAWEEGDTIVALVMESDAAPGLPGADGRPLDEASTAARLCRWTFDLASPRSGFRREVLDDLVSEFPRIDERFVGQHMRWGFCTAHATPRRRADAESILYDSLVRHDLKTGGRSLYTLPPGDVVSEPVFVPRGTQADEGDGWLLATAWRAREMRSDLLLFDALDLAAGPCAVARLPHRVPFGFHGTWRDGH